MAKRKYEIEVWGVQKLLQKGYRQFKLILRTKFTCPKDIIAALAMLRETGCEDTENAILVL